jgi:hypothetical protein
MRKFFVMLAVLLFFLIPATAHGEQVVVNGKVLDAKVHIENGTTLVALRPIFEALGATVDWDAQTKTVKAMKGDTKIQLTIGSSKAKLNNEEVVLDVPGRVIQSSTLVPLRFVSVSLGAGVNWDNKTKTATINFTQEAGEPKETQMLSETVFGLRFTVKGSEEKSISVEGVEKKLVIVHLSIENVISEGRGIWVGHFTLQGQDGSNYDYLTYANFNEEISQDEELFRSPPSNLGNVGIEPGETYEGKLGFVLPLNAQGHKLLIDYGNEKAEINL